jgi:plasmid maintenance system antidote protein VapI
MRLADYLDREKISPAEFARRIEMSEGMVSLLCRDQTWLSKKTAQRIFDITGGSVTPTDFLPQPEAAE